MVAENPLSNGDDHGPSLPPEPPDSTDPIATSSFENMLTATALLATTVENFKNQQITTTEYDVEKTSTTKQAQHPPAMAKFSHTPSPEPSNHTRVNPTRAEPSTLPAGTPPPISTLDIFSENRENRENPENTSFQYFQDFHGHGHILPDSQFDLAPQSLNTPPPSPTSQYPPPIFLYTQEN